MNSQKTGENCQKSGDNSKKKTASSSKIRRRVYLWTLVNPYLRSVIVLAVTVLWWWRWWGDCAAVARAPVVGGWGGEGSPPPPTLIPQANRQTPVGIHGNDGRRGGHTVSARALWVGSG